MGTNGRRRPLEVGILVPQGEYRWNGRLPRWSDLAAMARLAEDIGLDSLWVVDHLLYRTPDGEPEGMWECWSLLAALAAVTERVKLGTLVVCTNWRNPALIAKMAETVDEICGGRLILGLGAGNTEHEFRRFGFPWERRVSRFAEALHIIHGLLRNGWIDFAGEFYEVRDCLLRPRGPRPQGPPILVGGNGPRLLRLAARYADIWNTYYDFTGNRASGVGQQIAAFHAACQDVGRDPATVELSASALVAFPGHGRIYGVVADPVRGSPEEIAEEFRAYARAGVRHLQLRIEPNTLEGLEQLGKVLEVLDRG